MHVGLPISRRTVQLVLPAIALTLLATFATRIVRVVRRWNANWHRAQAESSAVRDWTPGGGEHMRVADMHVRVLGPARASRTIVLLHGLSTCGDYFGGAWDELAADGDTRVIIPDLPGFGRSLDRSLPASHYSMERQIATLERMIDQLGVDRFVSAGHSAGAGSALELAAARPEQVDGVLLIGPSFHDSHAAADRLATQRTRFHRLFTADRIFARIACNALCPNHMISHRVAPFMAPTLPLQVVVRSVDHSWNSYVGTLRATLGYRSWRDSLLKLARIGVPVRALVGEEDEMLDLPLLASAPSIDIRLRDGHGHQLPMTDVHWTVAQTCRFAVECDEVGSSAASA